MFTLAQIEQAHQKVKSGSDFPKYIHEIKALGVLQFTTWVKDSVTEYFGADQYQIASLPKYESLVIADTSDLNAFQIKLNEHQHGQTDYMTFCKDCANCGVVKWMVDLNEMTCTYYDQLENSLLIEQIPS